MTPEQAHKMSFMLCDFVLETARALHRESQDAPDGDPAEIVAEAQYDAEDALGQTLGHLDIYTLSDDPEAVELIETGIRRVHKIAARDGECPTEHIARVEGRLAALAQEQRGRL